ncbi:serine carboxypeptidase-like 20 isoform X2 [Ziziphus jujuba]|uniref:Carboxypeptidase n=1 Tax=Ziziphus jujuba TaxID=326968 RepID=A0A6P6FX37_ZIZJJ|nr:serine carboxypeptidase-like 20 isoform X2 [Ziziphus jujuba]
MDKFFFCRASICMFLGFVLTKAVPEDALITYLPGFNETFPSKHYSGYVSLDNHPPKSLFYYFVESEREPSKDPLVLWLNGGPGCSSMDGLVYEHGPFNFRAGKPAGTLPTLHLNQHSWSKVSNIIYLDSPAGVGLSFFKNTTTYKTGDIKTASDTHNFLLKWLEKYTEFISNPFYLAGESYAGVYVPTLASQIVKGIKNGTKPLINLKGYMVGNAVTDPIFDENAYIPFVHGMGLISDQMFEEVQSACGEKYHGDLSQRCSNMLGQVFKFLSGLNVYDILEPCYHIPTKEKNIGNGSGTTGLPISFRQLGKTERPLPVRKRMFGRAWPYRAPVRDGQVPSWSHIMSKNNVFVPCFDDRVAMLWLNDENVRKAIHASGVESEVGQWELCTSEYKVHYHHDSGSMIPYHIYLISQGYRALIFSGDHDMCVPFTGSEAWTRSLGFKILDQWRPWMVNGQVAGFLQEYENNLTFLTIKGAGHTVAEYKPKEALEFYSRWLQGISI